MPFAPNRSVNVPGIASVCSAIGYKLGLVPLADARREAILVGPGGHIDSVLRGGSDNHERMKAAGWGISTGDWSPYTHLAGATLEDPRFGIGSRQALSPCYDLWSRVSDIAALLYGPALVRAKAKSILRAWSVLARFGLVKPREGRLSWLQGANTGEWEPTIQGLPWLGASAATRGFVGAGGAWWAVQNLVPLAEFVVFRRKIVDPVAWHLPTPNFTWPYPRWGLWALSVLPRVRIMTSEEKREWRRFTPETMLSLAEDVPFGATSFGCVTSKRKRITWIDRDVHGTKPAVMFCKVGSKNVKQVSPVTYQSQGHVRSEAETWCNTLRFKVKVTAPGFKARSARILQPRVLYEWGTRLRVFHLGGGS